MARTYDNASAGASGLSGEGLAAPAVVYEDEWLLAVDKPAGIIVHGDGTGAASLTDLVRAHLEREGRAEAAAQLQAVQRLDRDTTGILLFTTDGDAAQRLLHPSFEKDKHYVALVEGTLSRAAIDRLERGITLDDGPCAPAKVERIEANSPLVSAVCSRGVPKGCSVVGLTIHEGRKHEVKRMLSEVGHEVIALHRDTFGPLMLKDVKPGKWRQLTPDERKRLLAQTKGE